MRKLTIIAALLGSVYFANAQVGIGTPDPALSAELDIVSNTKGILIPRVALKSLNTYNDPIVGGEQVSLLVFNKTAEIKDAANVDPEKDILVGFYYWENSKWNRIVSRAELNDVINTIGGDITNIQEVINFILPSNPDNNDTTKQDHTTIVFDSKENKFYEVTYEGGKYVRNEINMTEVIGGFETTTVMVPVIDANDKITGYKYFNETAVKAFLAKDENNSVEMITGETEGGVGIEVKGDVVNNIKEILESSTEIIVDGITFTTVEQYLQYITQFSEGNVIYSEVTQKVDGVDVTTWEFQYWDGNDYVVINLNELIQSLETETVMVPVIDANDKITGYKYFNEKAVQAFLAKDPNNTVSMITGETEGGVGIEVKGDVVNNIKEILESKTEIIVDGITFTTVEEYLQYITQFSKGNVIYEVHDITIGGVTKQVGIFSYWDGDKYVEIELDQLIKGLETETNLGRSTVVAEGVLPKYTTVQAPVAADVKVGEIFYQYVNEAGDDEYINMTEDIITAINTNTEVKNAITNVLNQGGNVYYGDHDDDATTPDQLYRIVNNNKEVIEIAGLVLTVIKNHIDEIKNFLGDHIKEGDTYIKTGDTINGKPVYKFIAKTTVGSTAGVTSARTSGVTIPPLKDGAKLDGFIGFTIIDGNKNVVATNVTDVKVVADKVLFNIGVGNHYTALPNGSYDVIVEFTVIIPLTPIQPAP